jgi:hypothetical protein
MRTKESPPKLPPTIGPIFEFLFDVRPVTIEDSSGECGYSVVEGRETADACIDGLLTVALVIFGTAPTSLSATGACVKDAVLDTIETEAVVRAGEENTELSTIGEELVSVG